MTIALTGATGFVGQAVLDAAARAGLPVRALTRREQAQRDGVIWIEGSLSDTPSLEQLVRGADAIVHVEGEPELVMDRIRDREGQRDGWRNVAHRDHHVRCMVKVAHRSGFPCKTPKLDKMSRAHNGYTP